MALAPPSLPFTLWYKGRSFICGFINCCRKFEAFGPKTMANGLILFFLLGLVLVSRAESRTIPTLPDSHNPNASSSSSNMPSKSSSSIGGDRLDDENCKGLSDEECLIKRSMVAHTDYIYTQDISSTGP